MSTTSAPSQTVVQVKRVFTAPRERVYRAWTSAEELKKWFFPAPEFKVVIPVFEMHVGGNYQFEMHHPNGNIHSLSGTYREVQPPEKISFTWEWQGSNLNTLVTVEFHDLGKFTEIVLTHELLPSLEEREKHTHGWVGCLDQLAKIF